MSTIPGRPDVPRVLLSRDLGYPVLRTRHRHGTLERVRAGAYRDPGDAPDHWVREAQRALAHVAAVDAQLSCVHVFTHQTAALLHGCWVGTLDGLTHITQPTKPDVNGVQGVRRHVANVRDDEMVMIRGLPVTSLERTIEDCARTMHPRDALCVADSGLRIIARPNRFDREASSQRLETVRRRIQSSLANKSGWRGIVAARVVVAAADGFSESAGESRLRWVALSRGLPRPVCQLEVSTRLGVFFVDIGWRLARRSDGREWVLGEEYDGRDKYAPVPGESPGAALYLEKRREDALRAERVLLRRRVAEDLRHPGPLFDAMSSRFPRSVRGRARPVPGLISYA